MKTKDRPSEKPGSVAANSTIPMIITMSSGISTRQAASMPRPTPAATIVIVMNMNTAAQNVPVQPSVARAPKRSPIRSPMRLRRRCSVAWWRISSSVRPANSASASSVADDRASAIAGAIASTASTASRISGSLRSRSRRTSLETPELFVAAIAAANSACRARVPGETPASSTSIRRAAIREARASTRSARIVSVLATAS